MPQKNLSKAIDDFNFKYPNCPKCNKKDRVIKSGTRKIHEENIQIYFCKQCSKKFTDRKIIQTSYSPKLILKALTYFNLGHTLTQTQKTMQRKHKTKIPISTLNNWVHRYKNDLPFIKLRTRYSIDPEIIIQTKQLQHQQPYLFQAHSLKLNLAGKQFPKLKLYINSMIKNSQDNIFQNNDVLRCSELAKKINIKTPRIKNIKSNLATNLANLALALSKTKRDRHQTIEDFFIINDSVTVACEIPVYILKNEANFENDLTGHIDMIQVRNNKIFIIDYKPDKKNEKHTVQQLLLYANALKLRTNIDPDKFICSFFDEQDYNQFYPNSI